MSERFLEIERLFVQLLTLLRPTLLEAQLQEVNHFVDVGEYGLALETVVDIFVEERKEPGSDVTTRIAELASKMSIDPAPLWRRLRI
jgi:hypothetical protein